MRTESGSVCLFGSIELCLCFSTQFPVVQERETDAVQFSSMTVPSLRQQLQQRNLPTVGNKAELLQRLLTASGHAGHAEATSAKKRGRSEQPMDKLEADSAPAAKGRKPEDTLVNKPSAGKKTGAPASADKSAVPVTPGKKATQSEATQPEGSKKRARAEPLAEEENGSRRKREADAGDEDEDTRNRDVFQMMTMTRLKVLCVWRVSEALFVCALHHLAVTGGVGRARTANHGEESGADRAVAHRGSGAG